MITMRKGLPAAQCIDRVKGWGWTHNRLKELKGYSLTEIVEIMRDVDGIEIGRNTIKRLRDEVERNG